MLQLPLVGSLAQATPATTGFERTVALLSDLATIVIALALIVGGLVAIFAALKARAMLRKVRADFAPALAHLTTASENVSQVSQSLRRESERLTAAVGAAGDGLQRAVGVAEERLSELNALAGVVQREAEDAFVRTASAVRGVQVGSRALRALRGRDAGDEGEAEPEYEDEDELEPEPVEPPPPPRRRRGRRGRDIFDE